ncbi:hypothetical protein JTE90_022298 [Oedothorax gibbosus]|uniref:Aminotransferase class I/classII domain-containing protein n=1 Tax=Oedothorax gibbosus TaxID=931172 RepID=A0AAV6VVQ6_9ARAC|nr:hypothetical protein JTE90_022298 [Oedothorax gibbosus]
MTNGDRYASGIAYQRPHQITKKASCQMPFGNGLATRLDVVVKRKTPSKIKVTQHTTTTTPRTNKTVPSIAHSEKENCPPIFDMGHSLLPFSDHADKLLQSSLKIYASSLSLAGHPQVRDLALSIGYKR